MPIFIRLMVMFAIMFASSVTAATEQANPQPLRISSEQQLNNTLAELKGQVVFLDFWASWCAPCRKSFPWLNEMQAKYQAQGFTVLAINLDVEHKDALSFLDQTPADFPIIYDPEATIGKKYDLIGMPSSYVFGRDGKIKYRHVGFISSKKANYEQEINQLLAAQP
ncbi:thiol-disulfide oxidoreductase resA [Pseudoalteromonas sp. BSi20652]|uniref:TlpA disulfide reductase family protein n=1 Tax=Pseudoalteromonas sp. BSi20652 TaxID=388384 RepID=UPI000231BA5A|nr:TlpA disulfide reductase family protein [Pseudoalteromonas sp. BSi20652]GAA59114.1 thiol-disulfide oxidoreductase resA [Pseudoalteromonas sp. BSi20652]